MLSPLRLVSRMVQTPILETISFGEIFTFALSASVPSPLQATAVDFLRVTNG